MAVAAPDRSRIAALRCWAAWLLAAVMLVWVAKASAHPMPETRIWVDTTSQGLRLTLQLPLNRLELAYGQVLTDDPLQLVARHGDGLRKYLLLHVGARSAGPGAASGVGWQVLRPRLSALGQGGAAELEAVLDLLAPPGADARQVALQYDAITHEVRTHRAQVYLRQDWAGGVVGGAPRLLGELDSMRKTLPLDLPLGRSQTQPAVRSLFLLGAHHIADGTDHLLFLLTLLLAAPLVAQAGRWAGPRPARQALRRLAAVVTAFTVGHTLTLALGSLGWLVLPAALVETAVAASILLAARHAWRPLLRHGELWMAGGFGLLHGLAFASSLSGGGLTPGQLAQALLAFNLGLEAVQLLVVLCAMPPLLVLAWQAPQLYAIVRIAAAGFAAAAAAVWLLQRLWPAAPALSAWVETAAGAAPATAVALWLLAAAVWWRRRGGWSTGQG